MKVYKRDTRLGRLFEDWHDRNDVPVPKVYTTCHIKLVVLWQLFYLFRVARVFNTRIPLWVPTLVAIFSIAAATFPEAFAYIVIAAAIIVVGVPIMILLGVVLNPILSWLSNQRVLLTLAEKISKFFLQLDKIRTIHYGRVPIGYIFWIVVGTIFEVLCILIARYMIEIWPLVAVLAVLFLALMAAIQASIILLVGLAFVWHLEESTYFFENRARDLVWVQEKIGLVSPTKLAERYPDREPKPQGIYGVLIEFGVCKFAKFE